MWRWFRLNNLTVPILLFIFGICRCYARCMLFVIYDPVLFKCFTIILWPLCAITNPFSRGINYSQVFFTVYSKACPHCSVMNVELPWDFVCHGGFKGTWTTVVKWQNVHLKPLWWVIFMFVSSSQGNSAAKKTPTQECDSVGGCSLQWGEAENISFSGFSCSFLVIIPFFLMVIEKNHQWSIAVHWSTRAWISSCKTRGPLRNQRRAWYATQPTFTINVFWIH